MYPCTDSLSKLDLRVQELRRLLPEITVAEQRALIEVLPLEAVKVVVPPMSGTIMATARDCFDTDFHLGEILVTHSEVSYEGQRSQATLIGDCPQAALLAAVLEVLSAARADDHIAAAHQVLEPAAQRIKVRQERRSSLAAATRVKFQTMAQEEPLP